MMQLTSLPLGRLPQDGRGCTFIAKGVSNRPDGFGKKNRQYYT